MQKVTVTLQNRETGATVTVVTQKRRDTCMCFVHKEMLKKHPGHYIKKTTIG